jgi:predicted ATPase
MSGNRITEIHAKGLRSLADVRLRLDGLTVLIGDNGSGKSSLIEACEILRRAASESFSDDLQKIHGGVGSLLRIGADEIELGVCTEDPGRLRVEYSFVLDKDGNVISEQLDYYWKEWGESGGVPQNVLSRRGGHFQFTTDDTHEERINRKIDLKRLALTSFGAFAPAALMRDIITDLREIDVHLPFDTAARWVQRSRGQPSPLRGAATIEPAEALSRFGANLPNAWSALKNDFSDEHWRETMNYVRLGLGPDVESINVRADPGGGSIALRLKYAGIDEQIPSFALSDGTLAYLAFVALHRLNAKKSFIAFDEHGLSDPARSVVLCELDDRRATKLIRPDPDALRDWLSDYRGLGDVRGAGHARSILTRRDEHGRLAIGASYARLHPRARASVERDGRGPRRGRA